MACSRNPSGDWIVSSYAPEFGGNMAITSNILIIGDKLWFLARDNSLGTQWLQGNSTLTGAEVGRVDIPSPDGVATRIYDIQVDGNGYVWVQSAVFTGAGKPAFFVLDIVNEVVVTSFLTATPTEWNGGSLHYDPINNLMWAIKDVDTLAGINANTYTVDKTIVPVRLPGEFVNAVALDTDKGELWLVLGEVGQPGKILVYNTATATLAQTLSYGISLLSHINTSMIYVPEKKWVVWSSGEYPSSNYVIWDTNTYAIVKTIPALLTGSGVRGAAKYSAQCDRLIGLGINTHPLRVDGWPASIDVEAPNTLTSYDDTTGYPTDVWSFMEYVFAVDQEGSVYFKFVDYDNYIFFLIKIAFSAPQSCFHITGAGGKSRCNGTKPVIQLANGRCDGTPPTTPIANNRNAPYV